MTRIIWRILEQHETIDDGDYWSSVDLNDDRDLAHLSGSKVQHFWFGRILGEIGANGNNIWRPVEIISSKPPLIREENNERLISPDL